VSETPDEDTVILDRALPTWAIDRLMFGVPDEQKPNATKVWGQFVSIAMSARPRGWTKAEFVNEVTRSDRRRDRNGTRKFMSHRLWWQLRGYSRDELHAANARRVCWLTSSPDRGGVDVSATEATRRLVSGPGRQGRATLFRRHQLGTTGTNRTCAID
jgi:hypothetical protein